MILLEIDKDKVLTIAMVPMPPNEYVINVAAGMEEKGDYDRVKLIPQIQILKRDGLRPLECVTLTPDELMAFLHLARAVGKTLEKSADIVNENFNDYRKYVMAKAARASKVGT